MSGFQWLRGLLAVILSLYIRSDMLDTSNLVLIPCQFGIKTRLKNYGLIPVGSVLWGGGAVGP